MLLQRSRLANISSVREFNPDVNESEKENFHHARIKEGQARYARRYCVGAGSRFGTG